VSGVGCSDLYVKPAKSYVQATRGDQHQKRHRPAQYLFYFCQIITFLGRSQLLLYKHADNLRKSLQRGRKFKAKQLLIFGSRNRRVKSRKERNYAQRLANSWLRRCKEIDNVKMCYLPQTQSRDVSEHKLNILC